MGLDRVPSGKDLPNDFNVVIEISMHSEPIKYEVDQESGAIRRSLHVHTPCTILQLRLHPPHHRRRRRPVDVLVLSQFALPRAWWCAAAPSAC